MVGGNTEVAGVVWVTTGADGPNDAIVADGTVVLASENTGIKPSDPAGDGLLAAGGPTAEVTSRMTGVSINVDLNQHTTKQKEKRRGVEKRRHRKRVIIKIKNR